MVVDNYVTLDKTLNCIDNYRQTIDNLTNLRQPSTSVDNYRQLSTRATRLRNPTVDNHRHYRQPSTFAYVTVDKCRQDIFTYVNIEKM